MAEIREQVSLRGFLLPHLQRAGESNPSLPDITKLWLGTERVPVQPTVLPRLSPALVSPAHPCRAPGTGIASLPPSLLPPRLHSVTADPVGKGAGVSHPFTWRLVDGVRE